MLKKLISLICPQAVAPGEKGPQVVASGIVERLGSYTSGSDWTEEHRVILFQGESAILELENAYEQGWGRMARAFALTLPGDHLEIIGGRTGNKIAVTDIRNLTLNTRLAGAKVAA